MLLPACGAAEADAFAVPVAAVRAPAPRTGGVRGRVELAGRVVATGAGGSALARGGVVGVTSVLATAVGGGSGSTTRSGLGAGSTVGDAVSVVGGFRKAEMPHQTS